MKKFLLVLGWLFLATTARSANVALFYEGGYFVQDFNTGAWSETIGNTEAFGFVEIARTPTTVDLYDSTRGMTVRLTDGAIYLKSMGEPRFSYFKPAHWDNRRVFMYNLGNGRTGYYQLISGTMYRHVSVENGTVKSSEYLRNNGRDWQTINLLFPATNANYAIQGNQMYINVGGSHWTKLFSGTWQ